MSAGFGQFGGWKREGRAFQAEMSMYKGWGMKAKPENHCRAGAEGRQEENWTGSLGQNLQGHEWSTRDFGPDPVVGKGEPWRNFKQGCDRARFVFLKAFSGGEGMGQDYGPGAERREWILETFWRENG